MDLTKIDENVLKTLRGKRGKRGKRGPPGPPGPPSAPPIGDAHQDGARRGPDDNDPFAKLKTLTQQQQETTTDGRATATAVNTVLKVENIESLTQAWSHVPTGTIAFLEQEEEVLIRIMAGWQHVQVLSYSYTYTTCSMTNTITTGGGRF